MISSGEAANAPAEHSAMNAAAQTLFFIPLFLTARLRRTLETHQKAVRCCGKRPSSQHAVRGLRLDLVMMPAPNWLHAAASL
jgi:hypothetical protein